MECAWWLTTPDYDQKNIDIKLSSCVPDDKDNCYLYYVRLWDSRGPDKRRLNKINDTDIISYSTRSSSVIVEYFGCEAEMPIRLDISLSE
ncbi:unnamed protein product [Echinostoma caproni]|uniref:CUB domain-containing protein n=1 Tax=Echinostoma caproni TaxID=27848 RepID=A0A183A966_9TREM|nr:unnamed protein product [Echinostoma caproni]